MIPMRVGEMPKGRRIALAALGVASAVALTAGLVWLALAAKPSAEPPKQDRIEPAQETTESALPSVLPTMTTSSTVTPSATPEATESATEEKPTRAPEIVRAARIAYRLGDTLYVAKEDGSAPRPVGQIAEGPYALSPDALTLAVVIQGRLRLLDTTSGQAADAGEAVDMRPVWMPDSSAVLFVRRAVDADEVRRVNRDGRGDTLLRAGSSASVSPNGRVVAITETSSTAGSGSVWVSESGSTFRRATLGDGLPTSVAAGNSRLYIGMQASSADSWIVSVGLDGTGARRLVAGPSGQIPAVWGGLCLSPDGSHLGAVALGDDEHSRISIFLLPRGEETRLNPRRDGYARCWSSSGSYLYFIEGNTYQGESTVLYRVRPDGSGRRVVATGVE